VHYDCFMCAASRAWTAALVTLVLAHAIASSVLRESYRLTTISDIIQCVLLACAVVCLAVNVSYSRARTRTFWTLMTGGAVLWLAYYVHTSYIEVVLRREVPAVVISEILAFLHLIPMMAAVVLQPHRKFDEREFRLRTLDFALLLVWWVFLYVFTVLPWQYACFNEAAYYRNLNGLFLIEKLIFLGIIAVVWTQSQGAWRKVYANLFGASLLYAVISCVVIYVMPRNVGYRYYSGSWYDVPFAASMAWLAVVALIARRLTPTQESVAFPNGRSYGVWAARLSMVAVLSLPVFAGYSAFNTASPAPVRSFRLLAALSAMLLLGAMVYVQQHMLAQDLISAREATEEANRELSEISLTDPLTKARNRRYFYETIRTDIMQVNRAYERATKEGPPVIAHRHLVLIMLDLDFFKRVNDEFGHSVGDRLLQGLAARLLRGMRGTDELVRWGGEEFLLICRSAERTQMPILCGHILEAIAGEPFDLGEGNSVFVTCSIGWSAYPWLDRDFEALSLQDVLNLADRAMYCAKSLGRNQAVGCLPSLRTLSDGERISLEKLGDIAKSDFVQLLRTQPHCPSESHAHREPVPSGA